MFTSMKYLYISGMRCYKNATFLSRKWHICERLTCKLEWNHEHGCPQIVTLDLPYMHEYITRLLHGLRGGIKKFVH